jgi:rhodanese-related sulfurtransferase
MKVLSAVWIGLVIVFIGVIFPGSSRAQQQEASGRIDGGLRILEIEQGREDLELTIYRGDYIVFQFADDECYNFVVPDLGINQVVPRPASEQPYVKMKQSGDYAFFLGERRGVLHVLELSSSQYQELTASEALELMTNVQPLLIDVRTPNEYNAGAIPGANLLPVQVFAENFDKLESFKKENILLYCATGNRSTVAAKILIDAGFSKVFNLRRGFNDWAQKGFPVH